MNAYQFASIDIWKWMRAYYIFMRLFDLKWNYCHAYHRKRIKIVDFVKILSFDDINKMSKDFFSSQAKISRMSTSLQTISSHHRNKFTFISAHQVLFFVRYFLNERFSIYNVDARHTRRVTFDDNFHSIHDFRFRSLFNIARTMTSLNNKIESLKNITSILKCLSHWLRVFKSFQSIFLKQKIEKLTREVKHFKQELTYHIKTKTTCMKFFDATNQIQQNLQNAIAKMLRRMTIFEQRFENYWKSQSNEKNWKKQVF